MAEIQTSVSETHEPPQLDWSLVFEQIKPKGGNPSDIDKKKAAWAGGVMYRKQHDAALTVKDLNDVFKNVYGAKNSNFVLPFSIETVRLIFDASKPPEVFYRILTSNNFDWNTDEYTKAIWDVLNADQRVTGEVSDMGREKERMGHNKSKFSFIVHSGLPLLEDKEGLAQYSRVTLGIVTIHELIYHKHKDFSFWNQKQPQGSNALYNHFKKIRSGAYNPIARKNLSSHPAKTDYFIDFTFNSKRVDITNRKRR
jgi:hypothetical protein